MLQMYDIQFTIYYTVYNVINKYCKKVLGKYNTLSNVRLHDDHFRLIGKRVVDFLLLLIQLFFARCYG